MNSAPFDVQLAFIQQLYIQAKDVELKRVVLSIAESVKQAREHRECLAREHLRS